MIRETENAVRAARTQAGIGRKALAEKLDVSEGTIRDWERGRNGICKRRIPFVAETLGLDMGKLFEMNRAVVSRRYRLGVTDSPEAMARSRRKLCGNCLHWTKNPKRDNGYLYGHCALLETSTERCEWCRME